MADAESETTDQQAPAAKPKRVLNDAQLAALAKGRAAAAARRAAKRAEADASGRVRTNSAEIRELQAAPLEADDILDEEDADDEDQGEPEPEPAPRAAHANGNGRPRSIDDVVRRHTEEYPSIEQAARSTQVYTLGRDPVPPPEDAAHLTDGVVSSGAEDGADFDSGPPKSLADLMEICPTLGDGQYYIEVVRRAPQHYGGVVCKGIQRPVTRFMTDRDFVSEYGGGDYTLVLYGPPKRGGAIDPRNGRPRLRALTPPVKLEISPSIYPPNLQAAVLHDDTEEDDMRYINPGFSTVGGGQGPTIGRPPTPADARMLEVQFEHEEKLREREEKRERELRESHAAVNNQLGPMLEVLNRNTLEGIKMVERQAAERAKAAEQQAQKAEQDRERAERRAEEAQRAAEERAERERNRPTEAAVMMEGLSKMVAALNKGDNGAAAQQAAQTLDQARQEIQRITQTHTQALTAAQQAHASEVQRLQDKQTSEMSRMQQDHRTELQRIAEQNRTETERLDRQHRDELKRLEDRLKDNVERAEKRAEEAERKAEQRIADIEQRSERRLGEVREEARRTLEDVRTQAQQRLDDERRQHERDLKTQSATQQTRLDGQKDMYENRLSTISQEITRLNGEVDRWRKDAEENRDITKHIERAEAAASALGWGPQGGGAEEPEPPKDWKEMVGRIGMDLVQKLPEIVQSAGETVNKIRGAQGPSPEQVQAAQYQQMMANAQQTVPRQMATMPPPLRSRDGSFFQPAPLRFGTEDGSAVVDPSVPAVRPGMLDPTYMQQAPQQQAMAPAMQPDMAPPTYQPMAPQQTFHQPPPPTVQMAPPPAGATYQPQQPEPQAPMQMQTPQPPPLQQQAPAQQPQMQQAPPGSVPAAIPADMILQFAPVLEAALGADQPVDSIASELLQMLGRDNMAAVIRGLKPERVVVELQKAGRTNSPLVRRAGQQFLRELWAAGTALLG